MARLFRDKGDVGMKIVVIVAILMILLGTLVPLYAWLADRAKISEVKENLAIICEAQVSYRAKHGTYHPCKESPANGGTDNIPDPWVDEGTPGTDAFADIGFAPKGPVRYKYSVVRVSQRTFTAVATGDLDEDGKLARFMVYKLHPKYPEPRRFGDRW